MNTRSYRQFAVVLFSLLSINLYANRQIFVSLIGSDANIGTIDKPLKTIQAAITLAEQAAEQQPIEICLRGGCYEQAETLVIGNNTRKNRLTIKSYPSEKVIISGGRQVAVKQLKKISDKKLLARLQPASRSHVRVLDLKKLNIPLVGLRLSGFGRPSSPAWSEPFVNERPLSIARWPNDSTLLIGNILVSGTGEHQKESPLPVFKY